MYVTVLVGKGGKRRVEGEKVKRKRGGGVDYATALVCLVSLQKMVWLDDKEERKRILMDLRVMTSHQSPYIVQYYGSVIWNVSALSDVCDGVYANCVSECVSECALLVLGCCIRMYPSVVSNLIV